MTYRVLRVPGTKNVKNPDNPLMVEIMEFHPNMKHKFREFKQFKVDVEEDINPIDLSIDGIPDRFWRVLQDDEKLRASWEGGREDPRDEIRSGHDTALANLLARYEFTEDDNLSFFKSAKGLGMHLSNIRRALQAVYGVNYRNSRRVWEYQFPTTGERSNDITG